ncbi:histidine phosphatase superfamily [Clohesyomyces aquaticus]|uniref:Histidine phosphatase superfamily n=1 Tax=Clohesyomyces aquaticus TaxID=1231657 RepID=A0A1Y1Z8E0_9PLEO|nr:histidine phosphatase superfamily [Clohesyomyces aquaticus]
MFALFLALMAAVWLVDAADNDTYQPWGAVVFTRTGERTPILRSPKDTQVLSAVGAQQMHRLGQAFRSRYIEALDSTFPIGLQQMNFLSRDLLNPDQLEVMTLDQPYLVASAQSFMQGLYPPYSINGTRIGPFADATGILANGSVVDFPLNGYQYAPIDVAGTYDPMNVYIGGYSAPFDRNQFYIGGDNQCIAAAASSGQYLTSDQFMNTQTASKRVYQALDVSYFDGHLEQDQIDYIRAFLIYDYLSYQYVHDSTTFKAFTNDSTLATAYEHLRYLADEQAWYLWGNTSASTTDDDMRAISGKTLSALILGQFQRIVKTGGNSTNGSTPLTFFFGEHEPFISLFSLMLIDTQNPDFRAVPPFASSMVFELLSAGSDDNDLFPTDKSNLFVRFSFQNGTDYKGELQSYSLFAQGPSKDPMPWTEFEDMMSRIMTNELSDYCNSCKAQTLFCWGVDGTIINVISNGHGSAKSKISPVVGGVIGAVVTLVVAGAIFLLAIFAAGIRFHRVQRGKKSELGGFKGSAKLASDPDLHLAKNGVPPAGITSLGTREEERGGKKTAHERVGSWELRQKEFGKGGETGERERESFEAIEAAMGMNIKPVEPEQRV